MIKTALRIYIYGKRQVCYGKRQVCHLILFNYTPKLVYIKKHTLEIF